MQSLLPFQSSPDGGQGSWGSVAQEVGKMTLGLAQRVLEKGEEG